MWRWTGRLDRGTYAVVGLVLFAIKHNVDRFVAIALFDRPWSLFYYISPSDVARFGSLSRQDVDFYSTLLAIAIPFIYVGTLMTVKRLRSAGLPLWLVALFFVPVVNLVFFAVLSVLPETEDDVSPLPKSAPVRAVLDRIVPRSALGSAAIAILMTLPPFVSAVYLSVNFLGQYGWSLFVGLPFCLGLFAVLVYGYHEPRNVGGCVMVAVAATVLLGLSLVAIAFEGIICVLMAAPIMGLLAVVGGLVGYAVQLRPRHLGGTPAALAILVVSIPALMGAEYRDAPEPPLVAVTTSIEIDAPPERVWRHVVAFSELPPPEELYFKTGIAYPLRAEIHGTGVGAVRYCVFSTGPFVEPIEVWEEPRLLRFSVASQPPAMDEASLWGDVRPPHLDDYLVSEGGQFLLTPLEGGRTRLEGTTWYRNKMWPAGYWQLWSDMIIHRIHGRVLEHVADLSRHQSRSR
jgi:hypothetical protein